MELPKELTLSYCKGSKLSKAAKGAIAELEVSIDLMKKQYEVFRAHSPSCAYDIIAYKRENKRIIKIEVRTGMCYSGKIHYGKTIHEAHFDLYAIVFKHEVFYFDLNGEIVEV